PLARRTGWPADPPDERDDVARAVSSLRDLEFARAAGTIAAPDYASLRATLERDAFAPRAAEPRAAAPVRTILLAALIVAVAALDGLGLILVASGSNDGALVAADQVLSQRPKDPDALFVKGLALYNKQDWNGAVDVWTVYLDVGQYHSAADMVRALYQDAKTKAGR